MSAVDDFWQFSNRFYADKAVKEHCLRLQDHWQLNVNYVLLAVWHGLSGRGALSAEQFRHWRHHLRELEQSIVSLRQVRHSVGAMSKSSPSRLVQRYYQSLCDTELKAEQALQGLLADDTSGTQPGGAAQRCADAAQSLQAYALAMGHEENDLQRELQRLLVLAVQHQDRYGIA